MFSANVKVEQQFQSLLAQSDALRRDLENQKLLRNESDSLVREARDKIHGHLDEITALKNETRSLRNLNSESDILAKRLGTKSENS